jgi:type IV pilus assembly protein PilA
MKKAFTLAEVLIVVAILGILAALAIPQFSSHAEEAKESAAKDNLRILRQQIEIYAAQHNGVPPGYPNGDTTATPVYIFFYAQLTKPTNDAGKVAPLGTPAPSYPFGPYISTMPSNPFNNIKIISMLGNNEQFPADATAEAFGWIYKPSTKEIRLNWPGTDKKGVRYYDY